MTRRHMQGLLSNHLNLSLFVGSKTNLSFLVNVVQYSVLKWLWIGFVIYRKNDMFAKKKKRRCENLALYELDQKIILEKSSRVILLERCHIFIG